MSTDKSVKKKKKERKDIFLPRDFHPSVISHRNIWYHLILAIKFSLLIFPENL